jgi:hypothetical protein
MRSIVFVVSVLVISVLIYSCNNSGNKSGNKSGNEATNAVNKVQQKDDGTINLNIEKASRYNDDTNPSCNTAEWNVIVSKPGRYKVWLTSATIDTMDLQYNSSVKISLQDERLEVKPVGDKIVLNASGVNYPYYRADSYMGTFYIQEAGEYSVQVISDKVLSQSDSNQSDTPADHTKLMAVFLTPMTR